MTRWKRWAFLVLALGGISTVALGPPSRPRPSGFWGSRRRSSVELHPLSRGFTLVKGGASQAAVGGNSSMIPDEEPSEPVERVVQEQEEGFTVAAGLAAVEEAAELDEEADAAAVEGGEDEEPSSPASGRRGGDSTAALQYRVVAILGCQSSGKSTLLNRVFGTNFPVLNAAGTGIQRTTRGIWADLSSQRGAGPPVVVLDMEGLESAARGDAAPVFDRRVACMAASVADVLVLNVWCREMEVGEEGPVTATGPQQLFRELAQLQSARPRKLVVVMRDAEELGTGGSREGAVALRRVKTRLMQSLREAYVQVGRPVAGLRDAVQLHVVALPHPTFEAEGFEAGVQGLRRLLLEDKGGKAQGGGGGQQLHPVPLSGFSSFARALWESLRSPAEEQQALGGEEEGDSQRPMEEEIRAFVRAKVLEGVLQEADKSIDRLRGKVEGAVDMPILEFGPDAQAILTRAVDGAKARIAHRGGSSKASRAEEARAIEAEVVAELGRRMEPLYRQHVEALAGYFSGKFQDRFNGLFCPVEQYNRETAALLEDVCNTFDKACRTAVPKALGGQWGYRETLERLREDLEVDIVDKRIEVEVAFPREAGSKGRGIWRPTWWKNVLLKALVVYINYLQTMQAAQAAARGARRRQSKYPPFPLF